MTHLRTAAAGLALLALCWLPASAWTEQETASESVHVFHYTWYRNPATDGSWAHWDHPVMLRGGGTGKGHRPPDEIGANFYPAAGLYRSMAPEDALRQMQDIRRAGAGVAAVTWWGIKDSSDASLEVALDAAQRAGVKICVHLEPFPGRNAQTTRAALAYLADTYGAHPALYRREGRPMVYLYDSYLTPPEEWAAVFAPDGADTVRGTALDCWAVGLWVKKDDGPKLKAAGFDGFYTYFATDGFTYGSTPKNWPAMNAFARRHKMLFIPSVGPGYKDERIRPWNAENTRGREDGAYYDRMFSAALALNPEIVSVTSYNEWHEGTQIEPAVPKAVEGVPYEDYGALPPEGYLDRTRHWAEKMGKTPCPVLSCVNGAN